MLVAQYIARKKAQPVDNVVQIDFLEIYADFEAAGYSHENSEKWVIEDFNAHQQSGTGDYVNRGEPDEDLMEWSLTREAPNAVIQRMIAVLKGRGKDTVGPAERKKFKAALIGMCLDSCRVCKCMYLYIFICNLIWMYVFSVHICIFIQMHIYT